jgi:hypothetical protein
MKTDIRLRGAPGPFAFSCKYSQLVWPEVSETYEGLIDPQETRESVALSSNDELLAAHAAMILKRLTRETNESDDAASAGG